MDLQETNIQKPKYLDCPTMTEALPSFFSTNYYSSFSKPINVFKFPLKLVLPSLVLTLKQSHQCPN